MKKLPLIIVLTFLTISVFAQKVYSVEYSSQADVKVFVVDYESQADLCVYKVDCCCLSHEFHCGTAYF